MREASVPYVASGDGPSTAFKSDEKIGAALAAIADTVTVAKGMRIYRERDRADAVFAITEGVAKTFHTLPSGVERISAFRYAGDFLGLADEERYGGSAMAIADTTLLKIPLSALRHLIARNTAVAVRLLGKVCEDLREAEQHIAVLGRGDAIGKVALFIEMLDLAQRRRGRPSTQIYLPMSRSDVADYVGLSAEALSRAFTMLGRQEILTYKGKRHLTIASRARFRALITE